MLTEWTYNVTHRHTNTYKYKHTHNCTQVYTHRLKIIALVDSIVIIIFDNQSFVSLHFVKYWNNSRNRKIIITEVFINDERETFVYEYRDKFVYR